MIIFWVFIGCGIIYGMASEFRKQLKTVDAIEHEEKRIAQLRQEENERIENERKAKKRELEKQLKSVQYELYLMGKLDNFRPEDLTREKNVKKALQLEKQYSALWQKERKLKRELEKLDS